MVLIKYKRVTSISRKKDKNKNFVFQYQVLTIIQLNYLCFFLLYLHIYMISCKNRIESLTKKAGKNY